MSILDEIFSKIQTAQTPSTDYKQPKNENLFKAEVGATYTVRFIPYMPNPASSMLSFTTHGWESRQNGRYISIPCLKSWGRSELCPCCETRFAELKIGTEAAKAKARLLRQKDMHFANIYIVESPEADEIGKVKIWRYGAEIHKILQAAIVGEDSDEYGKRIFDLTPGGVDFRVRCERKGTGKESTLTYTSSKFISKPRDMGLSTTDIERIYGMAHDLSAQLPPRKTAEEIQRVLDDHYFTSQDKPQASITYAKDDDDGPSIGTYGGPPPSLVARNEAVRTEIEQLNTRQTASNLDSINDTVNDLLKEFELP